MTRSNDLSYKELVELVELVTEYLENSLPLGEQAQFEAHLAVCPGCRTYLEQMRQTVHAVGHLMEESLDPPTRDEGSHPEGGILRKVRMTESV